MRIDIFLKLSRLAPRRTVAQQLCEAGAVKLNGASAKSAHVVRPGDEISIRRRGRLITARVLAVPSNPPSKAQAASLFQIIAEEPESGE